MCSLSQILVWAAAEHTQRGSHSLPPLQSFAFCAHSVLSVIGICHKVFICPSPEAKSSLHAVSLASKKKEKKKITATVETRVVYSSMWFMPSMCALSMFVVSSLGTIRRHTKEHEFRGETFTGCSPKPRAFGSCVTTIM